MGNYKYDGKEYDFDAYKKQAIDNFNGSEKDRQAMLELLQHMTEDSGSYADLNKINFSTNYANERGLFGKNVRDSKHYRRAVGYLLNQFNSSTPYEAPKPEEKPKTKVTREWLGQQLLNHMGNTSTYTDQQKREAANKAFMALFSKLSKSSPDSYEFEDGYDLNYFTDFLNKGAAAMLTDDKFEDDNPYWGELGIANPFVKKTEQKSSQMTALKDYLLRLGLKEDDWSRIIEPQIKNSLLKQALGQYGIDLPQINNVKSPKQGVQPKTPKLPKVQDSTKKEEDLYLQMKDLIQGNYRNPNGAIQTNNMNLKGTTWENIDNYMSKLVKTQLSGKASNRNKSMLRGIKYEGDTYYALSSINTGDKWYAYRPSDNSMHMIPKSKARLISETTKYIPYKARKGGYLRTLRKQ